MSSLENSDCEEIKNLYNTFKENLKSDILNETISNKKDCYIIKKSWDTELSKNFNNYNTTSFRGRFRRNNTNKPSTFDLPNDPPEFINDIKNVINLLKNDEQLSLENFDLIELIATKSKLKARRSVLNYMAGNNKILLESKLENDIILIENAFSFVEGISKNIKKIYLIKTKPNGFRARKEKEELLKLLLSKEKFDSLNLDSYNNANSVLKIETEDIFKVDNGASSSPLKQKESSSVTTKTSYRYNRYGSQKEIKKEEKKQETVEDRQLETPGGEEKAEKNPQKGITRYQRRYQNLKLAKEVKKEEVSTVQNNYNETNVNTTTETETSNNNRRFRRHFYTKQSTDDIPKKNEESNYKAKNDNISAIDKDKELKKLKEELERLKTDNENLKVKNLDNLNSKDEYIKQNKDFQKDINSLKRQITDFEREQKDFKRKLENKDNEIKKINLNKDREIQNLKNEKKELNDKIRKNEESIKSLKTQEQNYLSKIKEYETNNKKKEQEFKKKIDNLEKDNINLSKINEDLEKEISKIKDELDKEIKEGDELFEENKVLKNNETEFNKKIKKLENDSQTKEKEYNNRISKLEKENRENISKIGLELEDKIKNNE